MIAQEETIDALKARFDGLTADEFRNQVRVNLPQQSLLEAMTFLKEQHGLDMLVDVTCVDYLNFRGATDRFGLVYLLASTHSGRRLTIRTMLNEPNLEVPTLTSLWEGANWMEREVWDMFGIRFAGHPDLRRILLPAEFAAHPLRKDYPLQGRGERHNFTTITRNQA